MLSSILLSALAVNAAPAKRQDLGGSPGYLIQFPTGATGPYEAADLCLAVTPNGQQGISDGSPIGFVPCSSVQTNAPSEPNFGLWDIQYGNQQGIQAVGTNYCLDAGSNPGSSPSAPGKVWTCYPGAPQQQFYFTNDGHIAVTGLTPCLDYSSSAGTNFVQCGSNSNNGDIQAFSILAVNGASGGSSSAPPTPSSTSSSAPSSTPTSGRPIYWENGSDESQCLTVSNGQFTNGSPVGIAPCATSTSQFWIYEDNGVTSVQLAGTNYCLDFGDGGGYNGVPMKIWQCYPGLFQQTLYYTNTNHIAVYNGNQCLDVEAGTSNVQGWQCSGDDVHQTWGPGV